jgi:hypothetical protein
MSAVSECVGRISEKLMRALLYSLLYHLLRAPQNERYVINECGFERNLHTV